MNLTEKQVFNPEHTEESVRLLLKDIYENETKNIFNPSSGFLKKHFINNILTKNNEVKSFKNLINNCINKAKVIELQELDNLSLFKSKYTNSLQKLKTVINTYYEYHNLFKETAKIEDKEKRFNIIEETDLETIYDKMQYHIEQSELKKYARSFVRSYKNLINEDTIKIFKSIKEEDVPREVVQKEIRKIAAFKDSNDLNNALKGILNYTASYNQKVKRKIDDIKGIGNKTPRIVYEENGITILEINDFEQANVFGTSQWCICYDEDYYNEYLLKVDTENIFTTITEKKIVEEALEVNAYDMESLEGTGGEYEIDNLDNGGKHYFLFNDNVDKENDESMIAFTIGANEEIQYCFDKEDHPVAINEFIKSEHINEFLINRHPTSKFDLAKTVNTLDLRTHIETALSPYLILSETRNPLSVYTGLIKKTTSEIPGLFIPEKLFEKSANDLKYFHEISPEKYISDSLFLINYINKHFTVSDETIYDRQNDIEIMEEDYERLYYDEDLIPPEDPITGMAYSSITDIKDLFEKDYFYEIAMKVSPTNKKLLFKDSENTIKELLNEICVDLEQSKKTMEEPNPFPYHIRNRNSNLLKYFQDEILHSKIINEKERSVALQIIMESEEKPSEEIQNAYIEKIANKEISFGKSLQAKSNKEYDEKLSKTINSDPTICSTIYGSDIFSLTTEHPDVLNTINSEAKQIISKEISTHNIGMAIHLKSQEINSLGKYDIAEHLALLYKNNIITKEQVNNINTSRIRFGDLEYTKKNYDMTFQEYIFSQKENNKNTKSLRMK